MKYSTQPIKKTEPGDYVVEIKSVEPCVSTKKGTKGFKITYEILSKDKLMEKIVEEMYFVRPQFLKAIDIEGQEGDTDAWVGQKLTLHVEYNEAGFMRYTYSDFQEIPF